MKPLSASHHKAFFASSELSIVKASKLAPQICNCDRKRPPGLLVPHQLEAEEFLFASKQDLHP